MGHECPFKSE